MYIPEINQLSFFQMYDNVPCKAKIISKSNDLIVNVIIFNKDGTVYDEREINLNKNDYRFFDAPIDSPYYYQILCLEENGYDGLNSRELEIFMTPEDAFKQCAYHEKHNPLNLYQPEFRVVIEKF